MKSSLLAVKICGNFDVTAIYDEENILFLFFYIYLN